MIVSRSRDVWWKMDVGDPRLGEAILVDAAAMEAQMGPLRAKYLIWESFTRGEPVGNLHFSMSRSSASWNPALANAFAETPSLNVIGSVVEALQSALFSTPSFVSFDTTGAPAKVRRLGLRKTRFVDGVWYQNQMAQQFQRRGRDCAVFGTGFIKGSVPFPRQKRIVLERRNPDCILVDMRDAAKGDPSRLIDRDYVQKDVVKQWYPKQAAAIDMTRSVYGWGLFSNGSDFGDEWCCIMDSYWLPPDRREDGRHVLSVGNVVLLDEKWKLGRLPYDRLPYNETSDGWIGKGVVQDLLPLQLALDENERNISDGVRKMAHAKILRHISSGTPASHFDNENGTIIDWQGEHPPQFIVTQAMPPEVYMRSERLIREMMQRAGVPETWVQGTKPAGLDSAPAQREYQDQVSQRFLDLGQRNEAAAARVAELTCALARLYGARAATMYGETITWDDVSAGGLDLIKAFPVSQLPQQPAARKQRIEEDFKKGLISREDYLRLRQYPDTEAWTNDEVAPRVLVEEQLDRIMETGTYEAPNPYQDNGYAFELGVKMHNRACLDGESDGVIGLLERYIDQAKNNMKAAIMEQQKLMPSTQPVQALVPAQPQMQ